MLNDEFVSELAKVMVDVAEQTSEINELIRKILDDHKSLEKRIGLLEGKLA